MKAMKFVLSTALLIIAVTSSVSFSQPSLHAVIVKNDTMRAFEEELDIFDNYITCLTKCDTCSPGCEIDCPKLCGPPTDEMNDKDHAHVIPTDLGNEAPEANRMRFILINTDMAVMMKKKVNDSKYSMSKKYQYFLNLYLVKLDYILGKLDYFYKVSLVKSLYSKSVKKCNCKMGQN
ncbi:MAG: hypothetical protein JNJ56_03040 [Ignavibacteria bacterium]|nr:hypothetical protein [Ignavibacteria bacterium]